MEFVDKEFVYVVINLASMTNCNSRFSVFFLCSLHTAFIFVSIRISFYVISVLWSIDGWVIHLVGIEIYIDKVFYFDLANVGHRVIFWGSSIDLYFFTSKGELIIVVYATILIVGKAAESMIYR